MVRRKASLEFKKSRTDAPYGILRIAMGEKIICFRKEAAKRFASRIAQSDREFLMGLASSEDGRGFPDGITKRSRLIYLPMRLVEGSDEPEHDPDLDPHESA